ncbi:7892_t:CDS:2, partial [Racocetra persica]
TAFNTRRKKACLIISAHHNPQSISELVQFKHIAKPEYIMDLSGRILVYLEQLDDYNAIILATNADFTKAYIKAGIKKGANRPMVSEQDLNNAQGLNHRTYLSKPKAKQIQVPSAVSNQRQGYIDLARAQQGLKPEDLLPDL